MGAQSIVRPNFFIVGLPKSGTTLFYELLRQHPQIGMSRRKELYYFDTDLTDFAKNRKTVHLRLDEGQYLDNFAHCGNKKVIGEATPSYIYSRVAAGKIYEFSPESKVLILLREPVSFLHSLHSQLVRNPASSGEPIFDFARALEREPSRRLGDSVPAGHVRPAWLFYSEQVKYAEQVSRYYDRFGKEKVKVVIFDDLVSDYLKVFKDVLEFLQVTTDFVPEDTVVNKGRAIRTRVFKGLKDKLSAGSYPYQLANRFVKSVLRVPVAQKIFDGLVYRGNEPLPEGLVGELKTRFTPEVQRISEVLERDLIEEWKY